MVKILAIFIVVLGGVVGILSAIRLLYSLHIQKRDEKYLEKCMAFESLISIVQTVVMSIEQEEKSQLLKDDHRGKQALRFMALNRVKAQLTEEVTEIISDNVIDVDSYILDLISQQVMLIDRDLITTNSQL